MGGKSVDMGSRAFATTCFPTLAALGLSSLLATTRVQARPDGGLRRSITTNGIYLTLVVPKRRYPRTALARVTVILQNVSGRAIQLAPPCAGRSPGAAVFTRSVQQVYPPAVVGPGHPTPGCFPRMPHAVLQPGAVRIRYLYVILGGADVTGTTVLSPSMTPVQTPFVQLVLSRAVSPRITYVVSPQFVVTVHPTGGEQGQLHYTYSIACGSPSGGGAIRDSGDLWHSVAGTRVVIPLLQGCTRITDLAFVAGWLDHPVARLQYHAPGAGTSRLQEHIVPG
ncbi:MAG TPA: hypothetical protein VF221_16745 [Chloroflexota bacterium]